MEEIFGPSGLFAKHHPDYEYRPGQVAMANAVADALGNNRHLLVEAGTGTGKTLAYLVPAIALGRRVIISTGTKTPLTGTGVTVSNIVNTNGTITADIVADCNATGYDLHVDRG